MADFRKLALEYVLSDDANRHLEISKEAAAAIQSAPRPSNPVARWVESIRPWMPSANDDQMEDGEDGESSGDVIARSKALSFLAGTLEHLDPTFLKPDQVNLLVAFFGSMFKVDHKAGIMPAAKALDRTASMKAFQPQKGNDIILSVCSLGEDFKNQVAETRATVYELLDHLVTNPDVASDLQYQHGTTAGFMTELLQLCRNERDPKCLMIWFGILKTFLVDYAPVQEVVDEIFSIFSAYFPISLRTSQHPSGITADDLKSALRECFSAHHRVASKAIPYLVGRLDQGDSVTVNVKVDILKTLTACLNKYEHVQQGITPFVEKIWSSLKYEVRNGEIEDTINATLEVIRTIAKRLTGDELRDFALTVQRDCLEDLANPIYTAASGKLLISVHSAKPSAFALMIAPSVTHIKENLRHTKSPEHTKNLLILLNSLLELRQVLIGGDVELNAEDAAAFRSTEPMLAPLHKQAYLSPFQQAVQEGAQKEEITIGQQAIKGMGLMVCQRAAQTGHSNQPMLPEATLSEICDDLAKVILQAPERYATDELRSNLVDEAVVALQKATMAYPPALSKLIEESFRICEPYIASPETTSVIGLVETLQQVIPKLAFISCSEVPRQGRKFENYVLLLSMLLKNLQSMLDVKAPPQVWSVFASGIHMTMRYYRDATHAYIPRSEALNFDDKRFHPETWVDYVAGRYPVLPRIDNDKSEPAAVGETMDIDSEESGLDNASDELHGDFILISLFVVRQLYRRTTRIISYADDTELSLELSSDFTSKDPDGRSFEDRYLHFIGTMATFVIREMNELEQTALLLNEEVVTLFRGDDEYLHSDPVQVHPWANAHLRDAMLRTFSPERSYSMRNPPKFPISGFSHGRTVVLSLGIVQPLHPTVVQRLVERGTAHQILIAGLLSRDHSASPRSRHVVSAILTILANKYPIEKLSEIVTMIEHQMNFVVGDGSLSKEEESQTGFLEHEANRTPGGNPAQARANLARPVYAITAGVLRRYTGNAFKQVLSAIQQGPANRETGHILARNLEIVFAPYESLKRDYFGQVKSLWLQRAYFELVKPMLAKAWPAGSNSPEDTLIAANYSIAVLAAVKHIPFAIYEDDTEDLVRLILCAIRYLPSGGDVQAGLQVLEQIAQKSPDRIKPFLKSVIDACMSICTRGGSRTSDDSSWMPAGYMPFDHSSIHQAQCRCLVIRLLGLLPPQFEHRHLLDSASHVRRMLSQASGDRVREVRKAALVARAAWAEIN
ncbi:DNA repair transcription protein [Colletotrichum truncatum]|uniref:DNA repair transcription protein n=1 Tax=Colletotrichum truncatum TaxID=5467 RepID=A0ACC3YXD0_COLTU|nr:DNA repair transcription protein [Colletotrichum truncatum]KAF6792571.1 DNA repair transcription protein [Colletotrichum truncatum]